MSQIITQTVKNAQRHFIVWGLILATIMIVGKTADNHGHWERPPAVGTLEYVTAHNTCKDTVEGEFPTGAIVYNLYTGGHEYTNKSHLIGQALDEEFADIDWPGYQVKYFCR